MTVAAERDGVLSGTYTFILINKPDDKDTLTIEDGYFGIVAG